MFLGLTLEQWSFLATIAGGFAALITLPLIYKQLLDNSKQSKRERSNVFASKYHDPDYLPHMIRARRFLTEDSSINVKWDKFETDEKIRLSVGVFLSLFEEIGAMYNMDLVDKEVIERLLNLVHHV